MPMRGTVGAVGAVIGSIPNRLQLAGGWIDQPFVSRHNPAAPGSMVVVQIEPEFLPMDRSGLASSTRTIAARIWGGALPQRPPEDLVRELYAAENEGKAEPSGSQDMIGLVYPGINRLDYDYGFEDGVFPSHIESCNSPEVANWLQGVLQFVPVGPRPLGYSPLGVKNLDPAWVARLGKCGADCYDAIVNRDLKRLGESFNTNMRCWETLLPHVVHHPLLCENLVALLKAYQADYPGAMFSGCGGGYIIVASEENVPGAFRINVRVRP
jgi:hypothetical protein